MADMLCLDFCRPPRPHTTQELYSVSTPLCLDAWAAALASHPDQAFARYICDGLRFGFRIGFRYGSPLKSASSNMLSATIHPEVVADYLQQELSRGRMLGPVYSFQGLHPLHINRLGVIPKGHNTGKWRLITDLSFPHGQSVNDGIDPSLCSLFYTTVDDIAHVVAQLSTGALLCQGGYRIGLSANSCPPTGPPTSGHTMAHVTHACDSLRPFPSVFAYCKQSKTGGGNDLGSTLLSLLHAANNRPSSFVLQEVEI